MVISEEIQPPVITKKISGLRWQLIDGPNPEQRFRADQFVRALQWYESARPIQRQDTPLSIHDQNILSTRLAAITDQGYTYEQLDSEFGSYSSAELEKVYKGLAVL